VGMLWMGGLRGSDRVMEEFVANTRGNRAGVPTEMHAVVKELDHQVARLSLLNQAMWETLHEKLHITQEELEAKAREIDLRDGVEDGRVTDVALKCPTCGRVSNSRHHKCLYCGQLFEKPLFG